MRGDWGWGQEREGRRETETERHRDFSLGCGRLLGLVLALHILLFDQVISLAFMSWSTKPGLSYFFPFVIKTALIHIQSLKLFSKDSRDLTAYLSNCLSIKVKGLLI